MESGRARQGTRERLRLVAGSTLDDLEVDRTLLWQLAGLAVLAFVVRLAPILLGGGLTGNIDYDDGVYMGSALSLVHGRIVYRDFFMLHPPGILYVLSPFAVLSLFVSDATAFGAARVAFMLLGALNTILVGLVAASAGRAAALAAAALYAVWIVPAAVEQTTWLIGPQNTLLLLALLALAVPRYVGGRSASISWRKAALVGGLLGLCGSIQIWGVVTAGVVFLWLAARTLRQPGGPVRPLVAYVAAGLTAVAVTFLPFLVAAGDKMIRIVIFDQLGRPPGSAPISARLRVMEGIPGAVLERLGIPLLPVIVFAVVVVAVVVVAWRRPAIRLWAALFVVQPVFLLLSPSFFGHYGGWIAPAAALCIGSVVGELVTASSGVRRRPHAVAGVYATGLAVLLAVSLYYKTSAGFNRSEGIDWPALRALIADARCPTSDSPTVLIQTGALRRILDNGCPLYVSPTGVSYDTDRNLRGPDRIRRMQVEYQAIMAEYFGGSDGAIFVRGGQIGLTDETWATIRASLPVEHRVGRVRVLLPAGD